MPRVSVIIPTHNRRDYVEEAIDSDLAQADTNGEGILVGDSRTGGQSPEPQSIGWTSFSCTD